MFSIFFFYWIYIYYSLLSGNFFFNFLNDIFYYFFSSFSSLSSNSFILRFSESVYSDKSSCYFTEIVPLIFELSLKCCSSFYYLVYNHDDPSTYISFQNNLNYNLYDPLYEAEYNSLISVSLLPSPIFDTSSFIDSSYAIFFAFYKTMKSFHFYSPYDLFAYFISNPFMLFYFALIIKSFVYIYIFLHPLIHYIFFTSRYYLTFNGLFLYNYFKTPSLKDEFLFNLLPLNIYYNLYFDYSFSHIMKFKRKLIKHLSELKHRQSVRWGVSELFCDDLFFGINFYFFVH